VGLKEDRWWRALPQIRKRSLLIVPRQAECGGSEASLSVSRGCPGGDRRRPLAFTGMFDIFGGSGGGRLDVSRPRSTSLS